MGFCWRVSRLCLTLHSMFLSLVCELNNLTNTMHLSLQFSKLFSGMEICFENVEKVTNFT